MYFTAAEFAAKRASERAELLAKQQEKEEQTKRSQAELQNTINDLYERLRDDFAAMVADYNAATPVPEDHIAITPGTRDITHGKLVPADREGWMATLRAGLGLLVSRDKDRLILQFYTTHKDGSQIGGQFHVLLPLIEAGQLMETIKLEGTNGLLLLRSNDRGELIKQVAALCLFKLVNLADDKLLNLNEPINITPENVRLQLRAPALK